MMKEKLPRFLAPCSKQKQYNMKNTRNRDEKNMRDGMCTGSRSKKGSTPF